MKNCQHFETMSFRIATISSVDAGLERVVCQTCRHVSLRLLEHLPLEEMTATQSQRTAVVNSLQTTSL